MKKKNAPKSAVVDTNLFVSGLIVPQGNPYKLLQLWQQNSFVLITSAEQYLELETVLRRKKFAKKYSLSQIVIEAILRRVDRKASKISLKGKLLVKVRDTKDEKILATALESQADYLVTGDEDLLVLKDKPGLGKLNIVTVREFLELLG